MPLVRGLLISYIISIPFSPAHPTCYLPSTLSKIYLKIITGNRQFKKSNKRALPDNKI